MVGRSTDRPGFATFGAELSAVHGTQADLSLEDVLHEKRPLVRRQGLAVLDAAQIRGLLTHPPLLPELQEDVLIHGGGYWRERIVRVPFDEDMLANGWRRLHQEVISRPPKVPWYKQPWFVSLLTAAVVLLAVVLWKPTSAEAWGWNRPGVLAGDVPADVYLNRLADAAEEWFDKQPETPQTLSSASCNFVKAVPG